jgi:two-component system LytT family response regulator
VEAIRRLAPDLVLLDVQMPVLDGFEVVEQLDGGRLPLVIFVTAYDQFALQAFQVHALDYLLKPFDQERFARAMERARDTLRGQRGDHFEERLRALVAERRTTPQRPARFLVKAGAQYVFVRTAEVEWIESAENYVTLHAGGRKYMLRQTMGAMEEMLDAEQFVRVRASAIVNLDFVQAVRPWSGTEYQLVMRDGSTLVSSRRYRDRLRAFLLR